MADPFASIRRKPAAATYGRKAIVARRLAQPGISPSSEHTPAYLHSSPAASSALDKASSDSSPESSASEDNSDTSQKRTRYGDSSGKATGGQEAKRTAKSAMSKLEQLYESTKSPERKYSSAREVLDSTKDSWDLGAGSIASIDFGRTGSTGKNAAQKVKRVVRDNSDVVVRVGESGSTASKRKPKPKPKTTISCASSLRAADPPIRVSESSQAKPSQPKATSRAKSTAAPKSAIIKTEKPKPKPAHKTRSQATTAMELAPRKGDHVELENRVPISASAGLGVIANSATDKASESSAWDMGDLLSSSPLFNRTAGSKRKAPGRKAKRSGKGSNLPSSSPPSTPGRLLESNKSSRLPSSLCGSESDSDHGQRSSVFEISTPKTQTSDVFKGPSIETSKRLQSRAFSQHVVYKYGRARGDDDDELAADFSRALGLPMLPDATSRPLLEGAEFDSSNDSINRTRASAHLLENDGGSYDRSASSEPFKRMLSDILQGFSTSAAGQMGRVCLQLLEGLADCDFCEELLCDKQGLSALLRGMHRARKEPLALSTAMLTIALAFSRPTVMQTQVLERQALEMVAELLRSSTGLDILTLRRRSSFVTREQHQCVARICSLAREWQLVGELLPVSTHNLALAALHGFTRKDDAAFLAMAPLLRGEMHESGCLDLIAERALTCSIPAFVGLQSPPDTHLTAVNDAFMASDEGAGDMWMDFDLPEERRDVPSALAAAAAKAAASSRDKVQKNDRRLGNLGKSAEDAFGREPDSASPTSASIALELEILQFCATASTENQDEILAHSTCVPMLLALLAKSQQEISRQGLKSSPVRALETVVLVLQLLVNLANSSTAFSARFVACDGMDIVAKNVAIVSQRLSPSRASSSATSADFSPTRKALADEVGDLRYDVLLVTSALLTNIVDSDPSCVVHISHVRQSQQCRLAQRCFPKCMCDDRASLVVLLARAFVSCHTAQASADATIAAGYLSVLLGFLMREPQYECREMIRKQLPRRDMDIVIEHIQKFMHISDTVNKRFGGLLGGSGAATGRTRQNACLDMPRGAQKTDTSAISIATANYSSAATTTVNATLLSVISSLSSST